METFAFSTIKNFRYECKFYVTDLTKEEIESILKHHPAIFREIYHQRFVNNIYLDSFNMRYYFDNINGLNRRLKVRIRWYGDLFGAIKNPMLELKIKHNLHVGKIIYPLKDFAMGNTLSIDSIRKIFNESPLPDILKFHLMELNFSLLNRFERKYFLSADRKCRVTIDNNIQLYALKPFNNNFLHKIIDYASVIMELKYNMPHEENIDVITNRFPFRVTRSSKYALGVERLNFG